jgi:type IV pilus assembly protein PilA
MYRSAGNKRSMGFTLVELLVVVLILAILMAVALPLYLSAIANSTKRTARANMQTIANAEQSFKLQDPNHLYTADLTKLNDLGAGISGPGDRTYTVTLGPGNCKDANGQTVNVPDGSFMVQSASASDNTVTQSDGCYVPGVTTE